MKNANQTLPWRWLLLGGLAIAALAHFRHPRGEHDTDVW